MPRSRKDSVSAIVYTETGSEYVHNIKSHKRDDPRNPEYGLALLHSHGFGHQHLPPVVTVSMQEAVRRAVDIASRHKRTQLIVDDGRIFLVESGISRLIDEGEWQVQRGPSRYKLQSDADKLPDTSFVFHLSDTFFSLGLISADGKHQLDILQYQNFGANTMEDFEHFARTDEAKAFVTGFRKYALRECIHNKLRLFVSYHAEYLRFIHSFGRIPPQRSLSQTASVIFAKQHESCQPNPHNDPIVSTHERKAAAGPMIRQLQRGRHDGWCYVLDISSLYPHIGKTQMFPTSLIDFVVDPDEKEINRRLKLDCIIAYCNVKCENQSIPKIVDGHCSWPVGQYDTYLPDPEFRVALHNNMIEKVYSIAVYTRSYLLKQYCETMIAARKACRDSGLPAREFICKQITNMLFGQFASRIQAWMPATEITDAPKWRLWHRMNLGDHVSTQYRSISGTVEKCVGRVEKDGSFPAIFAFMTSYARRLMDNYITIAGRENVFAVNTDAIICNHDGMKNLESSIGFFGGEVGKFRISAKGQCCVCYSSTQRQLVPPGDASEPQASAIMPTKYLFDALNMIAIGNNTADISAILASGYRGTSSVTISSCEDANSPMVPIAPLRLHESQYTKGLFANQ